MQSFNQVYINHTTEQGKSQNFWSIRSPLPCACAVRFARVLALAFLARSLTHSGSHYASPIVHSLARSLRPSLTGSLTGGTLFQWQALEKEEFDSAISQWGTEGFNRDGTLKHSYPDDKWVLVPLGHWNWKYNQARGNYSTYEQELLAGMLVLSSQARLLGSNPVVWLCDQEPVRTF